MKVRGYTRHDGVKVKGHTRKGHGSHRKHRRGRRKKSAHKRIMKSPSFRRHLSYMMHEVHRKAGTRRRRRR